MTEEPDDPQPNRSRGGRPPKAPADRRTPRLLVRMGAREKTRIQNAATRAGLSLSEHVRRKTLVDGPKPRVSFGVRDRIRHLGVRLNALARRSNATGQVGDGAELDVLLGELREVLREVRDTTRPRRD